MKAHFYIHIGLHKTGTSSIQATLFQNRTELLSHDINYLALGENHNRTIYPLFLNEPHLYYVNRITGVDTKRKAARKNAATDAKLQRELEANTCGRLVISGENLSFLTQDGIERFRDRLAPHAAKFRIVVYVRDPYAYITSVFQHRLRRGETYESVLANPSLPRYRRIAPFIQVFGRENVDIRLFDPARFVNGDLIADFLAAIQAAPELAQDLTVVRTNAALSLEATYLIREVNKRFPLGERQIPNPGRAGKLPEWLRSIPGQPFRCPSEMFAALKPRIDQELEWLRSVLGENVFPDRPQPSDQAPRWTEETLAAVALLINDLAKRATPERPPRDRPPMVGVFLRRLNMWRSSLT